MIPTLSGFTLKAGGAILGLLLIAGSYYLAYNKGHRAGVDLVKSEIAAKAIKAASAARIGQNQAIKTLGENTDVIIKDSKNGDGPLAPVLLNQLDRMRRDNR